MYLSPHDDGVETVATCASFDINSPTFAGNNAAPAFKGDFMFDMVANCAHDLKTVKIKFVICCPLCTFSDPFALYFSTAFGSHLQ